MIDSNLSSTSNLHLAGVILNLDLGLDDDSFLEFYRKLHSIEENLSTPTRYFYCTLKDPCAKNIMPYDHHVKDIMPYDHRIKNIMSYDHRVKNILPYDHRVKDILPYDHRVKDIIPYDHRVKDIKPYDHHVKAIMPYDLFTY
ncbi:hypothetical protein CDAR_173201 [Caerostris darwini]|uniref:Uncharacterized protein n=1 Tax=Caerostris darwini TaxID=1538125 RepID=A0AAV4WJM5_9ARAC|nr:hypothetical protein CDAR_173201 [Caerostris darwini]